MDWRSNRLLVSLFAIAMIASAQSSKVDGSVAEGTQERGYWVDPLTRLMWAGKDNGKDMNWRSAKKYCRDLRLGGYSD